MVKHSPSIDENVLSIYHSFKGFIVKITFVTNTILKKKLIPAQRKQDSRRNQTTEMCQTDVIKYTFIYTVKHTFIILTQNMLKN